MSLKSPTRFHNHWGSFASEANLPNVSGAPTQDAAVEVGDLAYVTGSGTYQCDTATVGSAVWTELGGGGGGRTVLWEWNGTDVTQFGDGLGGPTAVQLPPHHGSLSVGAIPSGGAVDNPSGNVLIYTATGSGAHPFYMINDLPALPEEFIVRFRLGPNLGTVAPGIVLAYQDTDHHFCYFPGTSGVGLTYLNLQCGNNNPGMGSAGSSVVMSDTKMNQGWAGETYESYCSLQEPSSGVDPKVVISARPDIGFGRTISAKGVTWLNFGGATDPTTAWHVSWQSGGSIRNVGILFYEVAAGASYVGEMTIYAADKGK